MAGGLTITERGVISIEAAYSSAERAQMDGYRFAFHSKILECDVYRCGNSYAIIDGYN